MYTVIETEVFLRYADGMWRENEREAFISWLACNPFAGDVIPGSGGLRKIRWSRSGMGKRGGARVIYYNVLNGGQIWLLIATRNRNSRDCRAMSCAKRWNDGQGTRAISNRPAEVGA